MKIIRPIALTDAMLTASNVTETDYEEWLVGTTFHVGDRCIVTTAGVHNIYEALVEVTGGSSPEVDVFATTPKWLFISATNRWKAFDGKVGTQTSNPTSITYTITPGQVFDSIAFLNIDAAEIVVTLTDPVEGVVYNQTIDLMTTIITGSSDAIDWYSYFFSSFFRLTDVVKLDIPPYLSGVLTIAINNTSGTAKVGAIVFGLQSHLGQTQYSPSIGIHDYSIKEADQFGVYSVTERAWSKRMSCDVLVESGSIPDVQNILSTYRATLLVWIGAESISSMIVYGFYKDFSIVISYPTFAICNIEIEGLT